MVGQFAEISRYIGKNEFCLHIACEWAAERRDKDPEGKLHAWAGARRR